MLGSRSPATSILKPTTSTIGSRSIFGGTGFGNSPLRFARHRRLLQAVWGPDYGDETEYLRVFINQLRKKVEPDPGRPRYILTEPWLGYRFERPVEPAKKSRDK